MRARAKFVRLRSMSGFNARRESDGREDGEKAMKRGRGKWYVRPLLHSQYSSNSKISYEVSQS